jgi:hypothetical protein
MKNYLTNLSLILAFLIFSSCDNKEPLKCSYFDLLKENYELTELNIKKNKRNIFYITGVVKEMYRPKDQPLLNECVIYMYDEQLFNTKSKTGKMITIKMKPSVEREFLNKTVTVKCKYKCMDEFRLYDDYENYFWIEFTNGTLVN